jgi:hypothetical protein
MIAEMAFRLISRSTTTGWLDWEHGELWLAPDGLLRRRRGWAKSVAGVGLVQDVLATSADPEIRQPFTSGEVDLAVWRGGLWIPAAEIQAARLRPGILTGRLGLTLADGRSVKLLWAKSTLTYDSLHDAMSHWLNDRLALD